MPTVRSLEYVCQSCGTALAVVEVLSLDGVSRGKCCGACAEQVYYAEQAYEAEAMRYNWYCVGYPVLIVEEF